MAPAYRNNLLAGLTLQWPVQEYIQSKFQHKIILVIEMVMITLIMMMMMIIMAMMVMLAVMVIVMKMK